MLLTPSLGLGLGPYGHNPFSPDFHLLLNPNNNNEQTLKFHQNKIQKRTENDDDIHSRLLFTDVAFGHAQDFVDSDMEKSGLFSPCAGATNSPTSLDVDSFYASFDEETTNCDIGNMDIEKWLTQAAFPSPPMDNHQQQEQYEEDSPPWMGEECTIGGQSFSSSPSSSFVEDNNAQTTSLLFSSPTTPTDGLAPSSPSPPARISKAEKTTTKKKRGATLSTTERKMRKKYQNKTAAEKYRVKKKSEKMTVQERHAHIIHENKELKLELENMDYRVSQLKQLFLDILHMPIDQINKNKSTTS